jgi:predicted Zn-dependent protease
MRSGLGVLLAALALGGTACDAPSIPARGGVYSFTLQDSTVQRVLHWPLGSTVRVAVAPGGSAFNNISSAVDAAIGAWNAVALYGEYHLQRVDALADADVVVVGSDAPLPVDVTSCPPSGSGLALTTFCLTTDRTGLKDFPLLGTGGPGHVKFLLTVLASTASDAITARRLVAHELGHVLGIAQHSPRPTDLMASPPLTAQPQPDDIATVLALYHTPATVEP